MKQSTRNIGEMANMFGLPTELYVMQRGVKRKGEMRYDIIIIPPYIINGHNNKTQGHYHSTGHEEHFEVLRGEVIFVFQKKGEFRIKKAQKGDQVLVPRDCFHITINSGKKTLKLGNWISDKCISDYKFLKKMDGMYYHYLNGKWVKNKKYKNHPKIIYD